MSSKFKFVLACVPFICFLATVPGIADGFDEPESPAAPAWAITDPTNNSYHEGDFEASGSAGQSNYSFILKVRKPNSVQPRTYITTTSGTSGSAFTWSETIEEPAGSWTVGSVFVSTGFELWVDGEEVDRVSVYLK